MDKQDVRQGKAARQWQPGLTAVSVLTAAIVLSACGGGGSGSSRATSPVAGGGDDGGGVTLPDFDSGFVDSGQVLGSGDTTSLALADIDADGDLDLVVANNIETRIYTNNGDGSGNFSDTGQLLPSSGSTLGDIDGDGDLDLLVIVPAVGAGRTRIFIHGVYLNNGVGIFVDSGERLVDSTGSRAMLGDIDGDGDLDVVMVDVSSVGLNSDSLIYRNDGQGRFGAGVQWQGGTRGQPRFLALADIDGDNDLDAIVTDNQGDDRIYANDGNGGFTETDQQALGQIPQNSGGHLPVFGDIDGDGDNDLVLLNSSSGASTEIFLNDGNGNFTNSGQRLIPAGSAQDAALGDVDGDGDLDLVVAHSGGRSDRLFLNDGNGEFGLFIDSPSRSGLSLPNGTVFQLDSEAIALGDVDGDGDLDIVIGGPAIGDRVLINVTR